MVRPTLASDVVGIAKPELVGGYGAPGELPQVTEGNIVPIRPLSDLLLVDPSSGLDQVDTIVRPGPRLPSLQGQDVAALFAEALPKVAAPPSQETTEVKGAKGILKSVIEGVVTRFIHHLTGLHHIEQYSVYVQVVLVVAVAYLWGFTSIITSSSLKLLAGGSLLIGRNLAEAESLGDESSAVISDDLGESEDLLIKARLKLLEYRRDYEVLLNGLIKRVEAGIEEDIIVDWLDSQIPMWLGARHELWRIRTELERRGLLTPEVAYEFFRLRNDVIGHIDVLIEAYDKLKEEVETKYFP